MGKEYYNGSGYADPTAYAAIRNIQREEVDIKANRLIKLLKKTITENDFILLSRIEIKDAKSGREFR